MAFLGAVYPWNNQDNGENMLFIIKLINLTTQTTQTNQKTQTTSQLAFQNMLSTWKFVNL